MNSLTFYFFLQGIRIVYVIGENGVMDFGIQSPVLAVVELYVRPSVCHTLALCQKDKARIRKSSPSDSPKTLWRCKVHPKNRKSSPRARNAQGTPANIPIILIFPETTDYNHCATSLPLIVWVNLHWNFRGGLRKTNVFWNRVPNGRSMSFKVVDFGTNR